MWAAHLMNPQNLYFLLNIKYITDEAFVCYILTSKTVDVPKIFFRVGYYTMLTSRR
jgi:hypothetical protein